MRNFFPSRPHGFGKTLLLHTLSERFTGDRERFKDLWIGRSDYAFPKHPVIFLSLPTGAPDAEVLERNIMDALDSIAGDHNLKVGWATSDMRLEILVRALHEKPGPGSPCSSTSMTPR
jgi:hypothetical protein